MGCSDKVPSLLLLLDSLVRGWGIALIGGQEMNSPVAASMCPTVVDFQFICRLLWGRPREVGVPPIQYSLLV
jgi:hypothetical protein